VKQLSQLHESFIDAARRPMDFGRLPVKPQDADVPVIPSNKWSTADSCLTKTYEFRLPEQRNDFLKQVLDHEVEVGHNADLFVTEGSVEVKLQTKDIGHATELDREFAAWSDELYRDVVYSLGHDRRQF